MNTLPTLHLVPRTAGQSRYLGLATALRDRIQAGEWPPGSALPAEQTLAAEHQVALGTLRQALALLAQQGLIERVHGRGTFVRQVLSTAPMFRFFRFGQGTGQVPQSNILARDVLRAPADVARRLGLPAADQALRIKRLRTLDAQPCLLEELWLPLPLFEPLLQHASADWGDLLYPAFARLCSVHIHRAVDEIGFGVFTAAQAQLLQVAPGHPCACVTRQAYDLAGRCVEVRHSRGDAHAFSYTVTIC